MAELDMWSDENEQRLVTAKRLHADVEKQVSTSFPKVASLADELKLAHPELAGELDQVVGHSMLRSTLMPEVMATLFLVQTEEPSDVIEGEVVDDPLPKETEEEQEVQDG